jgi:hypothetical protein
MIARRTDRPDAILPGADTAWQAGNFVDEMRSMEVTPYLQRPYLQ